ncbi:MAG TPA: Arm DNA-binding domain-containing protein [Burkholderiaceae bacterium]|nr:Arm DNA-binding domain-containing protein [Burkholderiaceae bacterium]
MSRVKLTAGRIAAFMCEDGKSQSFMWHATVHQLTLRVTSTGARAFIFQSTWAGKTIRMTIGSPKAWAIEQAESEARKLQTIVDSGKDPRQVKQDEIEPMNAVAAVKAATEEAAKHAAARDALTLKTV